jgi:CubicO group peptidase (beta-lactamase class C family)
MRVISRWRMQVALTILILLGTSCGGAVSPNNDRGELSASITIQSTQTPTSIPELVSGPIGKKLDEYLSEDNPLFSGSILVAKDGEILLKKGFNYANWELKVPNSTLTKFRISSITKPFTATLIMMLYERGLIDLEERMCRYLPNCPSHWQEITIYNLLNHTSGIPEYTTLLGANQVSRDPHNVSGLIDIFREEPLDFTPGDSYQYSNSNYILLGAVIEQVTNQRYDRFLQQVMLDPLEMENSGMDDHRQILKARASGYQIQGTLLVNAPFLDMTNAYATAGMYSTVEDLFLWDQALYSNQLLNKESLEVMFNPNFGGDDSGGEYGLGWQISDFQGHRKVGHTGGINGFRTNISRYIDDQVTIILLSNIETEDIQVLVSGMEEIIFGQN